jgi:hypothetical protein
MPHSLGQRHADDASQQRASTSGAELIFKSCVQESSEAPQAPEPPAASSAEPWWAWTERYIDFRLDALAEAVGERFGSTGHELCEVRKALQREIHLVQQESEQLRREFNAGSN